MDAVFTTYLSLIGLESSTASKIVSLVFLSIGSIIRPECIPRPTKEQWELTALELKKKRNLISRIAEGPSMGNIFE